ncbi:MAG: hypothetical protein Kow0010_05480 [Dehalococcoidia bacterium]
MQLTDEHHHARHAPHPEPRAGAGVPTHAGAAVTAGTGAVVATAGVVTAAAPAGIGRRFAALRTHREAFSLGTLYALGHGLVVTILGILAIVASEVLPSWIDPAMERVVGITLLLLAAYLFYSLYRFFRGGGQFRIRSRWMMVFAGVANAARWIRSRIGRHEHVHADFNQQYGARTAFGIGMIHGVGAETGTQALVIATAVGATSKTVAVITLLVFVVGLLISNSFITVASTVGFVSARQRQLAYVAAGFVAAVFSLVVGLVFTFGATGLLPDLDPYFRWVGGPA